VRRSLRLRLTVLAAFVGVLTLVVFSVGVVAVLRAQLVDNLDDSLRQQVQAILTVPDQGFATFRVEGDMYVEVIDDTGRSLFSLPPPGGEALSVERDGMRTIADDTNGDRFRVFTSTDDVNGRRISVATNYEDVSEPVDFVTRALLVAVPIASALLALLMWWLTGRSLRPVEAIRARVAGISAADLGTRVPRSGSGDEIDRLARTMNDMLERVDVAVTRQRRFVGDASHELRSPITRMRGELEAELAAPTGGDVAATYRSLLEETVTLQHLVEDLLQLAGHDASAPMVDVPVDLDDLVRAEAASYRLADGHRPDTSAVEPVMVRGDARQLARAVRNVLDNAVRHARSRVWVTLAADDNRCRLHICDDGDGIAAQDRERVFERFTRLDEARTRDAGGAGLGLAIVRDIVERHGGTVHIEGGHIEGGHLDGGCGTCVVIELPMLAGLT
jgi:signal transduction histidine kinase